MLTDDLDSEIYANEKIKCEESVGKYLKSTRMWRIAASAPQPNFLLNTYTLNSYMNTKRLIRLFSQYTDLFISTGWVEKYKCLISFYGEGIIM